MIDLKRDREDSIEFRLHDYFNKKTVMLSFAAIFLSTIYNILSFIINYYLFLFLKKEEIISNGVMWRTCLFVSVSLIPIGICSGFLWGILHEGRRKERNLVNKKIGEAISKQVSSEELLAFNFRELMPSEIKPISMGIKVVNNYIGHLIYFDGIKYKSNSNPNKWFYFDIFDKILICKFNIDANGNMLIEGNDTIETIFKQKPEQNDIIFKLKWEYLFDKFFIKKWEKIQLKSKINNIEITKYCIYNDIEKKIIIYHFEEDN